MSGDFSLPPLPLPLNHDVNHLAPPDPPAPPTPSEPGPKLSPEDEAKMQAALSQMRQGQGPLLQA
jgi:hypothetical protein